MKWLRVIGTFLAGKQYLIHALDYTEEEAMKLQAHLSKNKFTVIVKDVVVEEL